MKLLSVNEALENKGSLNKQRIYVEVLLTFDTEHIFIDHWTKTEQQGYGIWVEAGQGAFGYNVDALMKLSGKKVVCLGEFQADTTSKSFEGEWGFGHGCLWPAQIIATELVYYKKWYEVNSGTKT
jgi:hypothetical protein